MADLVGDWNHRQAFNERGVLFMIGAATSGGYIVLRVDKAKLPEAIVAVTDLSTEVEAVSAAERLRKGALN